MINLGWKNRDIESMKYDGIFHTFFIYDKFYIIVVNCVNYGQKNYNIVISA